jgi:hypothetical protein
LKNWGKGFRQISRRAQQSAHLQEPGQKSGA